MRAWLRQQKMALPLDCHHHDAAMGDTPSNFGGQSKRIPNSSSRNLRLLGIVLQFSRLQKVSRS